MATFDVAAPPSYDKLRGGYYTPEPLARFLAAWTSVAGERVLEPSAGDGAILRWLDASETVGVELDGGEADKARAAAPQATVVEADFFSWFGECERERWDGVAGNPPFIRYQHWTEPTRGSAFDMMRSVGMRPTKLTNAWVPFVVGAALTLRPGGRLGLVVPAELMQVSYAAELRAFLVDGFSELTVVTFRRLVFEGILQEVVLLLGVRGPGPAAIRVVQVEDAADLPAPEQLVSAPHAPALAHDREKWTKYFLEPEWIEALRRIRATAGLVRLGELADVDVGVVTGRNQFFVLRPSASVEHSLSPHVSPLISKSAHLRGLLFDEHDLSALHAADAPVELLALDDATDPSQDGSLAAYIAAGEAAGVHEGYKCSIRRNWWAVPSTWTPDAFLLRQIYDHPRLIANLTAATSTDTIHRVRLLNGTVATSLAAASINSITFAFSEVMGRSYGGGVLELEPREAEGLPFPDPHSVREEDVRRVDELLREGGGLTAALDYMDETVLVGRLGIDAQLVAQARSVWERLRDRRLARGRRAVSREPAARPAG
jgi:adenine-specific DNA methylase